MSGLFCCFYSIFDGKSCLANNVDPSDQLPLYVASDLDLHYLPMTLLWVSHGKVMGKTGDGLKQMNGEDRD